MTRLQRWAQLFLTVGLLWPVTYFDEAHAQQRPFSFPVGAAGILVVQPPNSMKPIPAPSGSRGTLAFASETGNESMLLLTPVSAAGDSADAVRRTIEAGIRGARAQAVETRFPVTTVQGPQAKGGYFKATDRAPKPGEYRHLIQGAVAVGPVVVPFTILFNDGAERQAGDALDTLKALRIQPNAGT